MKFKNIGQRNCFYACSIALLIFLAQIPDICHALEIDIDVSPNTINLQSQGNVCTVHTDIVYGDVQVSSVFLNGIAINSWKADDRGFFVAKFVIAEVKNIPLDIDAYNTLQLVGVTMDGEAFSGEQDIMVVDNIPAGGSR